MPSRITCPYRAALVRLAQTDLDIHTPTLRKMLEALADTTARIQGAPEPGSFVWVSVSGYSVRPLEGAWLLSCQVHGTLGILDSREAAQLAAETFCQHPLNWHRMQVGG